MITLVQDGRSRTVTEDELPLAFGGGGAQVPVPGAGQGAALAWLDLRTREDGSTALFVGPGDEPDAGPPVLCNGAPLGRTSWLHPGDLLRAGATQVRVEAGDGHLSLVVEQLVEDAPEPATAPMTREAEPAELIHPVPFVPRSATPQAQRRRLPRLPVVAAGAVLLLLAAAMVFLFTARVVTVRVDPQPEHLEVSGGFLSWETDGRHLLLPGTHRVQASAAGHEDLDAVFVVGSEREQSFRFELAPLPGHLHLELVPEVSEARVGLDGGEPAPFANESFELAPGRHGVVVIAQGYLPHVAEVLIRGRAEEQTLRIELVENAAELTVASEPTGATVRIDGNAVGRTPLTIGLEAGSHDLELSMRGRQSERRSIEIEPERDLDLGVIALARAPGRLSVRSTPSGATVTVDGRQRGLTPLELDLPAEAEHRVRVSLAGHRPESRELRLGARERRELELSLEALMGQVNFDVAPAGALLVVDGREIGPVPASLELSAVAHELELRAPGHETWTTRLVPDPETPSLVSVTLRSQAQAQAAAQPARLRKPGGLDLVLVEPGEFRMGASRREPGRRSNEKLRTVRLTRPVYLSAAEITNAQFRRFDSGHSSGSISGYPLDGDDQPVVRITWQQAARYCNWLSAAESLPLAYAEDAAGGLAAVHPLNAGYRLPTEAEWERAARTAPGGETRRYSWGDRLPPPAGSANLADSTSGALLPRVLGSLNDGHVASAATGSFAADRRGLSDMNGNVAEWVHDVYAIPDSTTGPVVVDPHGPDAGELHVVKGSSWMHSTVTELRLSFRDYGRDGRPDLGFRVARFPDQGEP
jgi:formylglycine-generating enzyme required for sulfatase activity